MSKNAPGCKLHMYVHVNGALTNPYLPKIPSDFMLKILFYQIK